MLIFIPPKSVRRRRVRGASPRQATAPVLVSATFAAVGDDILVLTFDQAVDVSGLSPGDLFVRVGATGIEWAGTAVFEQPGPSSVAVTMIENADYTGSGVTLTATNGAGIVASDGGAAWDGVADLPLPFPS